MSRLETATHLGVALLGRRRVERAAVIERGARVVWKRTERLLLGQQLRPRGGGLVARGLAGGSLHLSSYLNSFMSSSLEEPPLSDSPTLPQHLSTHQSYAAHAETPSVHAGNLSPEYAGPAPHSSPLKLDSQGTAGFGPGSIQSGAAGLLPRHPERSFSRAGLPPRVISPPLSHGRMSTGGMSGDSLAHYSLVQSRGGRFSVTTP